MNFCVKIGNLRHFIWLLFFILQIVSIALAIMAEQLENILGRLLVPDNNVIQEVNTTLTRFKNVNDLSSYQILSIWVMLELLLLSFEPTQHRHVGKARQECVFVGRF